MGGDLWIAMEHTLTDTWNVNVIPNHNNISYAEFWAETPSRVCDDHAANAKGREKSYREGHLQGTDNGYN